jgi:hypothetical protein
VKRRGFKIVEHQLCAFLSQTLGDGLAHATARAGYQGNFVT